MRARPADVAASIRDRLRRHASATGVDFQRVLDQYAVERLLYRLTRSPHADTFVLKGALLFSAWDGGPHRRTRDADLLGYGDPSVRRISEVFPEVAATVPDVDDGLIFEAAAVRVVPVREDEEYAGLRVTLRARLAGARANLQIDVAFGQAVVPEPQVVELPVLLDLARPRLRGYPVESVVAEKFEAIVRFGLRNGRLKDYYDLWRIFSQYPPGSRMLARSVAATFARRGTALPADVPPGLSDGYADADRRRQWVAFLERTAAAERPELGEVIATVRSGIMPIVVRARSHA